MKLSYLTLSCLLAARGKVWFFCAAFSDFCPLSFVLACLSRQSRRSLGATLSSKVCVRILSAVGYFHTGMGCCFDPLKTV